MKRLLSFTGLFLFLALLVFNSCKHNPEEIDALPPGGGNTPDPPPIDTLLCDSSKVTYTETVLPILNAYCISCHSGQVPAGALDFNDYSDVSFVAQSGQLLGSIKHAGGFSPMPKDGNKLSECEIDLIEIWVNDTTFVIPPDTTECDTSFVSYTGTVYPIFEANCISCHAPPTPEAGIDLTNFENVAFIAQNGSLMGAISHQPDFSPMPKDAPPLTECEIIQIQKWINDTTFTPGGSGGIPCDPDTVYFQNDILPLLQSSCGISGCHDPLTAEDDVILTSYYFVMQTADVVPFEPWESDIVEVINESDPEDRMPPPPASPLSQDQKDMIYTWILQGALNNYCEQEDCDSTNVSFSETVFPIIQNSCYGCHSGANPGGGINLTNHSQISAAGAIPPGNTGSLLGAITWASGNIPMPQNGQQLSECKIAQIRNWINEGMPDN
ncbi:MAG: c-type cytochrome domain-containing protein [Bacteroidales bacterium]